jgi:hypothetical protein
MTEADETELHRLCDQLEQINRGATLTQTQREALKKAALALTTSFVHGLRRDIERQFDSLGQPLSAAEQARLDSLDTNS